MANNTEELVPKNSISFTWDFWILHNRHPLFTKYAKARLADEGNIMNLFNHQESTPKSLLECR